MVLAGRVGCKLKVAVGSMNVELAEIRAWVDGELDEPRASVVGNAVLTDETVRHTAAKLRASLLPYRQAYQQMQAPVLPSSLRARVIKVMWEQDD